MSQKKNNLVLMMQFKVPWYWIPVAISAAGLICLFIGFFGSYWWGFDILSNFRPQYAVFTLISAVLLSFKRKFLKFAIFAYMSFFIICLFLLPLYFSPLPDHQLQDGVHLRVMQINVFTGNSEYKKVEAAILRNDPDIILLDEVNWQWLHNLSSIKGKYPYRIEEARDDNFGIAMFAKIKPEKCEIRMSRVAQVPYIYAKFVIDPQSRKSVSFFGLHTLPPVGNVNYETRNAQLVEIAEDIAKVQSDNIILLGDLNLTPWSYFYNKLEKDTGLRNSQQGFGVQPTWPDKLFFLLIPIDHCLVSPAVKVTGRRVGSNTGSDHYPLIVDLEI
jgi:endonuclease/exonuclease/phosphatase (EEP) superfamily protein YafD